MTDSGISVSFFFERLRAPEERSGGAAMSPWGLLGGSGFVTLTGREEEGTILLWSLRTTVCLVSGFSTAIGSTTFSFETTGTSTRVGCAF